MSRRTSTAGPVLTLAFVVLLALAGGPSRAAGVAVRVEAAGPTALLIFDWGSPTTALVTRDGRTARARFSRAGVTAAGLVMPMGRLAGWIANLDVGDRPDEVRLELRDGVSVDLAPAAAGTTVLALRRLPPPPPPPPEPRQAPTTVRGDELPGLGRLLLEGDPDLRVEVERRGRELRVAAEPSLPDDAAAPARSLARWVEGATVDDPSTLRLRLRPNVVAREGRPGPGRFALDLSAATPRRPAPVPVPRPAVVPALAVAATPSGAAAGDPPSSAPSPETVAAAVAPAAGPPPALKEAPAGKAEVAAFRWRRPVPAALFERADVLWVVFGGPAGDLAQASLPDPDDAGLRELPRVDREDLVAYRFLRLRPGPLHLSREGDLWRLGRGEADSGGRVSVSRGLRDGLTLGVTGRLATVEDPEVRDRLHLLLSDRPGVGLAEPLAFVDLEFVPASTGVVWRPLTDSLRAEVKGDRLEFSRPGPTHAAVTGTAAPGLAGPSARQTHLGAPPAPDVMAPPAVAAAPSVAPLALAGITADGRPLRQRRQETLDDLAELRGEPAQAARIALARLFLADAMAAEALATLDAIKPGDGGAPEGFAARGAAIRAAAELLLGRERRAVELLAALPDDRRDPELALWRAAAAAAAEDWGGAEQALRAAGRIWADYPPRLRFRLGLTVATVLAQAGRTDPALAVVDRLDPSADGPRERADLLLLKGDILARDGRGALAASAFAAAAREGGPGAGVSARFLETASARERGELPAGEALRRLTGQRLLWRGHPAEPRMLDALAALEAEAGEPLAALETWQAALAREPGDALAGTILGRMRGALEGALAAEGPDAPDPVSALTLLKAYSTLLPTGEPAGRLVDDLADRLAGAGLPAQAAALLDERLAAAAGAPPPALLLDLARHQLAADRPEAAQAVLARLDATAEPAVVTGRHLVRAEALLGLGRPDEAHRQLEGVEGPAAARLRSAASWRVKAWPRLRAELLAQAPSADPAAADPGLEAERQARLAIAAARSDSDPMSGPEPDRDPPPEASPGPLPGMISASRPPAVDTRGLVRGLGDRIAALRAGLADRGPGP